MQETLVEELIIVCLMIGFFLLHVPSTMIPVIVLPIGILMAFIPPLGMKLTSNIMSLGGIVIAIGDMVDASIIIVENAHKRLDEWSRGLRKGTREEVLIESMKEVGPTIFASLVVIAVAFMPVFTLEAQEGAAVQAARVYKNFAILFSAVLAITLVPALVMTFLKGEDPLRGKPPRQPFPGEALCRGRGLVHPAPQTDRPGRRRRYFPDGPRVFQDWFRVHASAQRRGPSCICPRRCRACR